MPNCFYMKGSGLSFPVGNADAISDMVDELEDFNDDSEELNDAMEDLNITLKKTERIMEKRKLQRDEITKRMERISKLIE